MTDRLSWAIRTSSFDNVKNIIAEDASLLWRECHLTKSRPADAATLVKNAEILRFMYDTVMQTQPVEKREELLKEVFWRRNTSENIAFANAFLDLECLKFFVEMLPWGQHALDRALGNKLTREGIIKANDLKILEYIVAKCSLGAAILELRDDNWGETFAHAAVKYGRLEFLEYIVSNAPSGARVLEFIDKDKSNAAHHAWYWCQLDALVYIINTAPSGISLLYTKNKYNATPLTPHSAPCGCENKIVKFFTDATIRTVGLKREFSNLEHVAEEFASDSLVKLMMCVMMEDIRVTLWREKTSP